MLFRRVVEMRGTLSGEHGIGVLKAPYLPLEQSADLIALQKQIKATLDPSGLLNPGKIFPTMGHGAWSTRKLRVSEGLRLDPKQRVWARCAPWIPRPPYINGACSRGR
ncbi:MAG: FAD-linked oxidase C-terminal domain-containing protein [Polyangiaceae bacterium]